MLYFNNIIGLLIVITYLAAVYLIHKGRRITLANGLVHFALSIYIAFIAKMMIFPIPLMGELVADSYASRHNFIPLVHMFERMADSSYVVLHNMVMANFVAFIPVGFIACLLTKDLSDRKKILNIGIAVSASKELLQLAISLAIGYVYRGFDVDSVILSLTGYSAGFMACMLFVKTVHENAKMSMDRLK